MAADGPARVRRPPPGLAGRHVVCHDVPEGMTTLRTEAQEFLRDLRDRICARLEELDGGKFQRKAWERPGGVGGGMDLTPCKEFVEDTRHFHRVLQKVCNAHGPGLYDRLSRWAKEYFFIGHRGSERGVGGIFFDYLRGEERWSFLRDVGEAFLPAYAPLVERRRATPYSDEDRAHQLRWRGRYVEFNLLYDRGTLFGLRTGGNVEAIFMSLPPLVAW